MIVVLILIIVIIMVVIGITIIFFTVALAKWFCMENDLGPRLETSESDAPITRRQVMFGKSQTEAALGIPARIHC